MNFSLKGSDLTQDEFDDDNVDLNNVDEEEDVVLVDKPATPPPEFNEDEIRPATPPPQIDESLLPNESNDPTSFLLCLFVLFVCLIV